LASSERRADKGVAGEPRDGGVSLPNYGVPTLVNVPLVTWRKTAYNVTLFLGCLGKVYTVIVRYQNANHPKRLQHNTHTSLSPKDLQPMYPIPAPKFPTRIIIALTQRYRAYFPMDLPILVRYRTDSRSHICCRSAMLGTDRWRSLHGVILGCMCET